MFGRRRIRWGYLGSGRIGRAGGTAEAHVARRAVRGAGCPRGHAVPGAVGVVAQVRAAADDPLRALVRTPGVLSRRRGSGHMPGRAPPVGAPLPDVACDVVESEPVGWEGGDRRGAQVTVRPGVVVREVALPEVAPVLACWLQFAPQGNRARSRPPRAARSHSASVGRRLPAQRAYASASRQETCTTGWSERSSMVEPGSSGDRQVAPRTESHHGGPAIRPGRMWRRASEPMKPAKTNDQPNRSASLTWPVAATNSAYRALGTAVASRWNGLSSTSRTGPSPSAANASSRSSPIRNVPPAMATMPSTAAAWRGPDGRGASASARDRGSGPGPGASARGVQHPVMAASLSGPGTRR